MNTEDEKEISEEDQEEIELSRTRLPRGNETFGILEARLGASRTRVRCLDGKVRICRIPGKLKRKLWVREGDIVIVKPWELGGDERGDIIFKYRPAQIEWLRKQGKLKKLDEFEEF